MPTRGDPGRTLRQVASQVTLLVNHCRTETHPSDREGTGLRAASFTFIFCAKIIFVRPVPVQAGSVELQTQRGVSEAAAVSRLPSARTGLRRDKGAERLARGGRTKPGSSGTTPARPRGQEAPSWL